MLVAKKDASPDAPALFAYHIEFVNLLVNAESYLYYNKNTTLS